MFLVTVWHRALVVLVVNWFCAFVSNVLNLFLICVEKYSKVFAGSDFDVYSLLSWEILCTEYAG